MWPTAPDLRLMNNGGEKRAEPAARKRSGIGKAYAITSPPKMVRCGSPICSQMNGPGPTPHSPLLLSAGNLRMGNN